MIIDDLARRSAYLRRWLANTQIVRVPFPIWPLTEGPSGPAFHWTSTRIPPGILPEPGHSGARELVPECPPAPAAQIALTGTPEERGFLLITETRLNRLAPPGEPGLRESFAALIGAPAAALPINPLPALHALGFERLLHVTGISDFGEGWPLGLRADTYQYFVRQRHLTPSGLELLALAWMQTVAQESRRQGNPTLTARIEAFLARLGPLGGPVPARQALDPLARAALPMLFGRGLDLTAALNEVPPAHAALAVEAQRQQGVSVTDLLDYFTEWLNHGLTVSASLTLLARPDIERHAITPPAGPGSGPPYCYERLVVPTQTPYHTP